MAQQQKNTQTKILRQLELLNERTAKHNSIRSTFAMGIVYGIGFLLVLQYLLQ